MVTLTTPSSVLRKSKSSIIYRFVNARLLFSLKNYLIHLFRKISAKTCKIYRDDHYILYTCSFTTETLITKALKKTTLLIN